MQLRKLVERSVWAYCQGIGPRNSKAEAVRVNWALLCKYLIQPKLETRYMERTNSMRGRGKRSLDGGGDEEHEPEKKRPALASVIVEALKMDSLQKLCSSLEPILRRVVSEEVERALAKLGPATLNGRSSPKRIEGPDGRNLQLHFKSRPSLPLFTGGKVEGEQGAAIHAVLIDADTGHVVTSGPESSVKLDIVVLEGDFNNENDEGWTQEEFESHVVKEREGKRPLLTGDLQVTLKEGVGTLGDLTFTDNSSWIRSRKFRLGLKVASGYCEGIRVQEAKTEAFTVKDHRGELYKKHYPPALNDEVWRLEKIGKDGSFHRRLNNAGIFTVEDFLRLVVRDSQKLRSILGNGMSNKMWDALIEHSKTCVLSGKLYIYYPDETRNVGVVFNNIYELGGLIANDQYYPADSLSDSQKVHVDTWVKKAYDNWSQVVEYDGKSLLNFKQIKESSTLTNDLPLGPVNYPNSLDNQLPQQRLPVSVPFDPSVDQSVLAGGSGYDDDMTARYRNPSQLISPSSRSPFDVASFTQNNHEVSHPDQFRSDAYDLALGPPQSTSFQHGNSPLQQANPFEDWASTREKGADLLSEEEIRIRSHEMLENEDMQHLLRLFSMGGHAPVNVPEDGYGIPSYMPSSPSPGFSYNEDRTRSGKAVVGWLKIKAAMRWGIFIRKKAAERRAQLVELED
ncbi:Calmodulin-binding protein [Perilla frutescens var. hirtella]|uniref:Calmodulin-binding protein n=1 Tax=Perilla frutescens var. hirtella TaxID=608512 RepID=A0AAD4JKC7_PERFH|nr:Calmodulin-binding protein [Perilla frutescens var. hirtella]